MGMNYGHRMHFVRLFSAIIRKPRLTRPRKICYKYQRETAEIGVEKNEKKDLDDPGMHHIHFAWQDVLAIQARRNRMAR